MKTILLTILALGFAACGSSQNVPSDVLKSFESRYKKAENVTWSSDNGVFSALYKESELVKKSSYQKDGEWIETVTELLVDDLMTCITDYVDDEYMDASIFEAILMESPETKEYQISLEYLDMDREGDEDMDLEGNVVFTKLIFDTNCEFLSEE
ncbi:hypothetical protein [Ekhidna sp.]|uniref:hypothetical protein n=1 Tax=Ekhidna sp. TaxID=2608089 RepID=UPI003BA88E49